MVCRSRPNAAAIATKIRIRVSDWRWGNGGVHGEVVALSALFEPAGCEPHLDGVVVADFEYHLDVEQGDLELLIDGREDAVLLQVLELGQDGLLDGLIRDLVECETLGPLGVASARRRGSASPVSTSVLSDGSG